MYDIDTGFKWFDTIISSKKFGPASHCAPWDWYFWRWSMKTTSLLVSIHGLQCLLLFWMRNIFLQKSSMKFSATLDIKIFWICGLLLLDLATLLTFGINWKWLWYLHAFIRITLTLIGGKFLPDSSFLDDVYFVRI